tara:strand:- start:7987 stop:12975 length:4989 start_codon:yes stop_codon:yes gene_type:complete
MKKSKFLLCIALSIGVTVFAQDTSLSMLNPNVDIAAFDEYLQNELDSLDEEDTLEPEGALKHQLHFVSFWRGRVGAEGTPASGMQKMDDAIPYLSCTQGNQWEPLGPLENPFKSNDPSMLNRGFMGMVGAVAAWENNGIIDTILAGSASAGIFRTVDGGVNWTNTTDALGEFGLGINCIEVSPFDPTIVLAGAGFTGKNLRYGASEANGYLKSTTKGEWWSHLDFGVVSSGYGTGVVEAFAFDHTTSGRVYAAVDDSLLVSLDDGVTWSRIWGTGQQNYRLMDLKMDPNDANLLYATTYEVHTWQGALSARVYRIKLSNGQYSDQSIITPSGILNNAISVGIDFCADKPNHVYSLYKLSDGRLQIVKQSTDSAGTVITPYYFDTPFTDGKNDADVNRQILEFVVSPTDETEVYVGGVHLRRKKRIYTYDRDFNLHDDIRDLKIIKPSTHTDSNDAIILCGHDGGISISYNSGGTDTSSAGWTTLNGKGMNITQAFQVRTLNLNGDIVYGSHDNGSYVKSIDEDRWRHIGTAPPNDGQIVEVSPNMEEVVFLSRNNRVSYWNPKTDAVVPLNNAKYNGYGEDAVLKFDPYNDSIIYFSDDNNNIMSRRWKDQQNSHIQILNKDMAGNGKPHIAEIATSTKNRDVIYTAIERRLLNGTIEKILFRYNVITKVLNDITAGLTAVRYNQVSDIEVDPDNENKIWVTFANWDTLKRVYAGSWDTNTSTMTWTNMSFDLPEIPINKILFDQDNNRFYLATDGGVFTKTNSMSDTNWICFSNGLPRTIINNLHIDQCRNKLIAATFGRGIWMADLMEPVHSEWPITGTTNIMGDMFFKGDIIIKPGATLNIGGPNDSVTLYMAKGKSIIIENSGELNIENSKVTNGCGTRWKGIQVWGERLINQNQNDPSFSRPFSGKVELLNATISNAEKGIVNRKLGDWSKTGGIIEARTSHFLNNQQSLEFKAFRNLNPSTQQYFDDLSLVLGCTFENDSSYFFSGNDPYNPMITFHDVHGVDIASSTFKNSAYPMLNRNQRGIAILEHDANTKISGNTFDHMSKGIVTGQVTKLFGTNVKIRNNTFTDTWIGSITKAHDITISISNNQFDGSSTYGSWLEASTGVEITENTYGSGSVGVITADLGAHGAEVYNNDFEDHDIGVYTSGKTGKSNRGLTYKCNDFIDDLHKGDIYVASGMINEKQGKCNVSALNADELPAGNEFSQTCNASEDDYNLYTGYPGKMLYSHHSTTSGVRLKPDCYTTQKIQTNDCAIDYDTVTSCPSRITTVGTGSGGFGTKLGIATDGYSNSKSDRTVAIMAWNNNVDGGNTTSRVNYVNDALNSSDEVKTELDNYIPYLSDAVLTACINRNPALDASDLYYILEQSSPLSVGQADQLSNLGHILSTTQIEDLIDLQGGISLRDSLELDTIYHQTRTELYLNEILRLFAFDTSSGNPNPLDSMISYLEDYDNYHPFAAQTKNMLVKAYWQDGDFSSAQAKIDELDDDDEYKGLAMVLQKLHNMESNGDSLPVLYGDSTLFDSLATDTTHFGYGLARNVMSLITYEVLDRYTEEIPGDASRSEETPLLETPEEGNSSGFTVYPNPNGGSFHFVWNINTSNQGIRYRIVDMQGRVILEGSSQSDEGNRQLQIPQKTNGIYKLQVFSNKKMIHQENIVVSE